MENQNQTQIPPLPKKEVTNQTYITAIKEEIERKGYDAIMKPIPTTSSNKISSTDYLLQIMKEGDEEFKSKVGRPMTYAEMREIYG